MHPVRVIRFITMTRSLNILTPNPALPASDVSIYTIGHGNRSLEEFLALLNEFGIRGLVDVRSLPGSRKHPHFSREHLAEALRTSGIRYLWEGKDLGGFRKGRGDSPHTSLESRGFRAYADHMETEAFRAGVDRLLTLARESPTAFFCAERLPWKCHRFLLSDFLTMQGARVFHIVASRKLMEHHLSPPARKQGYGLVYDLQSQKQLKFE